MWPPSGAMWALFTRCGFVLFFVFVTKLWDGGKGTFLSTFRGPVGFVY